MFSVCSFNVQAVGLRLLFIYNQIDALDSFPESPPPAYHGGVGHGLLHDRHRQDHQPAHPQRPAGQPCQVSDFNDGYLSISSCNITLLMILRHALELVSNDPSMKSLVLKIMDPRQSAEQKR